MSDRKRAEFSSKDMVQDLNRLLRAKRGETVSSNTLPELDKQVKQIHADSREAICSHNVLIGYTVYGYISVFRNKENY